MIEFCKPYEGKKPYIFISYSHRNSAEVIGTIRQEPLDMEKMAALPGMVIYVVKPGDNLWNIGKEYYVPVDRLLELNDLSGQEVEAGQKLLIVKGA